MILLALALLQGGNNVICSKQPIREDPRQDGCKSVITPPTTGPGPDPTDPKVNSRSSSARTDNAGSGADALLEQALASPN